MIKNEMTEGKNILYPGEDIIYFDSDDEFYDFCVVPALFVVKKRNRNGDYTMCTDFDLSPAYHDYVKQGKKFCIKNQDSQIFKHGCVSYRCVNKPIQNLIQYFGED